MVLEKLLQVNEMTTQVTAYWITHILKKSKADDGISE